jgi:ketosteroid isomerase-like protein
VNAYIAAYQAKDTQQILPLFSGDAIYMDQGSPEFRAIGEMNVSSITTAWAQTFQDPLFQVNFESYFISSDGTSAALKTVYTDKNANGNPTSVPMIIILEIKDGKIVREDDYYDYSPFQ